MNRDRWNWDSTRALYFGRPFVSIVLYEIVFLYSPGEDSLHSTLLKYCTSCQVVPSIVFHVRPLRNESATLTHSFTPSSFGRMQLTLFIQLQSIEVGLQGFTQHYKYRWYLVRKCRQWLGSPTLEQISECRLSKGCSFHSAQPILPIGPSL